MLVLMHRRLRSAAGDAVAGGQQPGDARSVGGVLLKGAVSGLAYKSRFCILRASVSVSADCSQRVRKCACTFAARTYEPGRRDDAGRADLDWAGSDDPSIRSLVLNSPVRGGRADETSARSTALVLGRVDQFTE